MGPPILTPMTKLVESVTTRIARTNDDVHFWNKQIFVEISHPVTLLGLKRDVILTKIRVKEVRVK